MDNREENLDEDPQQDESSDSELEAINAGADGVHVPLDIPPRDISRHLMRSSSDITLHTRSFPRVKEQSCRQSFPLCKQKKTVTQVLPRSMENKTEKLTLVVDETRFVVERSLFIAHPNTMLGR